MFKAIIRSIRDGARGETSDGKRVKETYIAVIVFVLSLGFPFHVFRAQAKNR